MTFQLVQLVYWTALSMWFGGVIFIAWSAPVIFRTVLEADPLLPTVLSVNLEKQHGTLLAGTIVANVLARLGVMQLVCGTVLALSLLAHLGVADLTEARGTAAIVRAALLVAAVAVGCFDRFVVWPRMMRSRGEYLANADNPDVANPAKDRFDRDHQFSVTLLLVLASLLAGLVLFSVGIASRSTATTFLVPG